MLFHSGFQGSEYEGYIQSMNEPQSVRISTHLLDSSALQKQSCLSFFDGI